MLKKIVGIICVAAVMMSMLGIGVVNAEDSKATISVIVSTTEKVKTGETFKAEVVVSNNPGIAVAGLKINYDNQALKLTNVTDKGIWGEALHSATYTKCPYKLYWYNPLATEDFTTNGMVAELTFEVLTGAETKDYPITVSYSADNEDIINVDLEGVEFVTVSGKVSVLGNKKEDVSGTPTSPKPVTPKPEASKEMTSEERKEDVICLKMGASMTITHGVKKLIDDGNAQVVPYINNDRTMVPVRFISEALDAEVLWEDGWDGCIIKKGDKVIKLTFGSAEFTVNGEKFTYDAPMEMLHDRTMVPVRFISEHLDCDVYWEPINNAVLISPIDNPWVPDRKAEINAVNEMLLSILNIL